MLKVNIRICFGVIVARKFHPAFSFASSCDWFFALFASVINGQSQITLVLV